MDDIRLFIMVRQLGWRMMTLGLAYKDGWRLEEEIREVSAEEKIVEVVLHLRNKIHHNLTFAVELPKTSQTTKSPPWTQKCEWMEVKFYDNNGPVCGSGTRWRTF